MRRYLKIMFFITLWWVPFKALTQDTIALNTTHAFKVSFNEGYTYNWWFINESGVRTELSSTGSVTEEYLWDTEGKFQIQVQAQDGNGCLSEIVSRDFFVKKKTEVPLRVYAGADTTIGSCSPYTLNGISPLNDSYTYRWEPETGLSNPDIPNPVFTPGSSSSFVLTVTNDSGVSASDTVHISVAEIYADAGVDIVIDGSTNAILDAKASYGTQLIYKWTTENGNIVEGADGPNPVVSSAGTYYLKVRDRFYCTTMDSVIVSRVTYAPVAHDDYDTTAFQTTVNIPVLDNDEDPDGDLDRGSLEILQYPVNGSVYINYDDYTLSYTPNQGFVGGDVFEYQVCDLSNLCDNASVYVMVSSVDFLIPEAFSPNGDNVNDFFEIKGIGLYPGNSISIVNRWGKLVYEARNYGIDTNPKFWDGTWQRGDGKDLPSGTYFYVLDLGNGQQPIAGSVYIDR